MTDQDNDKGKQKLWFIRRKGAVKGPFPSGSIRRFVLLGRVLPDDEVSYDRKNWQRVADVPEVVPPEARKAIAEGNLDLLLPARMREDERTGRDRRESPDDKGHPNRRKGDRRQAEPEVMQKHREAKTELREASEERKRPVLAITTVLLLILAAVGYGFYLGAPETIADPDCTAQAAPGVNWRNCRLDGMKAESVNFEGGLLNNAILRDGAFSGSQFKAVDMQYADLSGSDLSYAEMQGALMKGTTLRNSDLSYSDLSNADLSFADLSGANLGGANLEQARFGNAIWIDGNTCLPGSIGGCSIAPK